MKKGIFIALLVVFSSTHIFSQDTNDVKLVIIKLQEYRKNYTKSLESVILITEDDGTFRTIPIDDFTKNNLTEGKKTQQIIHKELKSYLNKGYSIISHEKGSGDLSLFYEDYILIKRK